MNCAAHVTTGETITVAYRVARWGAVMRVRKVKSWQANRGRYRLRRDIGPLAQVAYFDLPARCTTSGPVQNSCTGGDSVQREGKS